MIQAELKSWLFNDFASLLKEKKSRFNKKDF